MFQYVPMTGEGGTNSIGTIGQACDYDPEQERTFDTIEDLMRFKGSTTHKASVGSTFGIECDPAKRSVKTMYCRDEVDRDKLFTDLGTYMFASEGCGNDQVLGHLWVTYSIKFRNIKPHKPFHDLQVATLDVPTGDTSNTVVENNSKFMSIDASEGRTTKMFMKLGKKAQRSFEVTYMFKTDADVADNKTDMILSPLGNGRIVKTTIEGVVACDTANVNLDGVGVTGTWFGSSNILGDSVIMVKFIISFEKDYGTADGFKLKDFYNYYPGRINFNIREIEYVNPKIEQTTFGA